MHGTNLVVYTEPEPYDGKQLWTRHVLDSSLVDGHALACRDVLGMGSDQIVVGWRAMNKPGVKVGIKLFTDRKSTRLNSSHSQISYAVFCLKKKKLQQH